MKFTRVTPVLHATLLGLLIPTLPATETIKLEPVLYVFKDADFSRITVGRETSAPAGRVISFSSPANLAFDQETLALDGMTYAWNGSSNTPPQFSMMALPAIVTLPGQPATLRCALPAQYLEKAADGSLQVREIPRDSLESPHYQVTLNAQAAGATTAELLISGETDITMIKGREKIPGVDLDAGRPIFTSFQDSFKFKSPRGVWSGVLLRRPGESDYSVLLLLKATTESRAPQQAATGARESKPVKSGPTRYEMLGYSVTAPAQAGWERNTWLEHFHDGVIFVSKENALHYNHSAVYYNRAGFSVMQADAFPDRKSFLDFVKQGVAKGSDAFTFGYAVLKQDFAEMELNGLWLVSCNINGEGLSVRDPALTRVRVLYATDPNNPGRMAVVWYAWRCSAQVEDAKYEAEAATYLGTLQKTPP